MVSSSKINTTVYNLLNHKMLINSGTNTTHVMLIRVSFFVFICLTVSHLASGQSRKKKDKKNKTQMSQPTSVDPYFPQMEYVPEKSKMKSRGIRYDAVKNFYARKAQVEKEKRKLEKELMKPQYSDPMYFGHKHPPKKHKPGKMKYCKVCGIRH